MLAEELSIAVTDPLSPNSTNQLLIRLTDAYHNYEAIEQSLANFITDNPELVTHIVDNWLSAVTPGFWTKILKLRLKTRAMQRLARKILRALLHPDTGFVMNVRTIEVWVIQYNISLARLDPEDMLLLYDSIIALDHSPEFVDALSRHDPRLLALFRDKLPYIRNNKELFERRVPKGPSEYPRLRDVAGGGR